MSKSKIFLRDLLGLILILSSISVTIAVLLDVLAVLTHFSHEDMISSTFFHESLPLFLFVIPAIAIAKYINRPEWVEAVKNYRLNAAKNLSDRL
ncbi:D-fructose-6-phosphate amidotransferase [Vibrio sp. MA40-2]|uniref:D-fructose-6-phosphate amidotransferase n=1 Tax=Vibrio sp. MA40-2 TaxID=3391828 RepID=UPI0039A69219